jgi:hypothetical protein
MQVLPTYIPCIVYWLVLHVSIARFSILSCCVVTTPTKGYWLIICSTNNHGLMKKRLLYVHILQVYKHGLNSQITINSSSKPNKIPFFKCGFGVNSWGDTWRDKQNVDQDCVHNTCTCVWVLESWVRWCGNFGGIEHTQKLTPTKGYQDPINK